MWDRETRLLSLLSESARVLSTRQAMRLLGIADEADFNRFVRNLAARGLVSRVTACAKPVPPMSGPLLVHSWSDTQGRPTPTTLGGIVGRDLKDQQLTEICMHSALERVLYLAWKRWANLSAAPTPCLTATTKACRLFGVHRGASSHGLQATHDLAVGEVAVSLLDSGTSLHTGRWVGEDSADFSLGGRRPDLVLLDESEGARDIRRIAEVVGADYSIEKLLDIHHECQARRIAYELW